MSQQQYIKTLQNELRKLNEKIDRKIMLGRTYKLEARQHRAILMKMRQHEQRGFFAKISSAFFTYA